MHEPKQVITGFLVQPNAIYETSLLSSTLGIAYEDIEAQAESGNLRYATHGGKKLYLGEWVIAWLKNTATTGDSE